MMIQLLQVGDIISWMLSNPEVGWVVVIVYLAWEIRGPKGAIHELKKSITSAIVVIRALARIHESIDTEEVDNYLVENGMEPVDFIKDEVKVGDEEINRFVKDDD